MENSIKVAQNKCYGCKSRQIGCHSVCEDYRNFKKHLMEIKMKERIETILKQKECDKHENFLRKNKDLRGK